MSVLRSILLAAFVVIFTSHAYAEVAFRSGDDITGALCCKDFRLTDQNGRTRTLADFKGKVVVVVFGFTHCDDECPTTLHQWSFVRRQFGSNAKRIQVLFITVDPERDTPRVLSKYLPSIDPSFLGLYGDAATIAATAKEFRVFYQKNVSSAEDGGDQGYDVDHSTGSYVFDTQGRARLFVPLGAKTQYIVSDVRALLGSSRVPTVLK